MIDLPDNPGPNGASPSYVDFGGFVTPALGGSVQRIDRMGNRFKIAISMPPMPSKDTGRIWVSRLIRGKTEGARIDFPLLDFAPGSPGTPVINGAGQAGRTLNVRGLTPHYTIREGQWLSVEQAGQHYLYNADAGVTASGTGTAAVSLSPMLRAETVDGAKVHLAKPMIEGFIEGEEWAWEMSLARHIGLEFTIAERA